ncbi:MAG: FeoA family protein [Cyanobacteria bacterium J06635_13]
MKSQINIRELAAGSQATIVGYKTAYRGYMGKLLSKGLIVGKTLTVMNSNVSEDGIEVMLDEQLVYLSKPEADALDLTLQEKD